MNPSNAEELDVPAIMRIGAARMTAGLDRMGRLDLAAHTEIFGPLPRLSVQQLIDIASEVDLRGQGGAAFPFARKLKAVVDTAKQTGQPIVVVVNATEGEPGSFKDKMLMIRSPYLIISGAALVARGTRGRRDHHRRDEQRARQPVGRGRDRGRTWSARHGPRGAAARAVHLR